MLAGFMSLVFAATPESFVLLEPGTTLLPPPGITTDAGTIHPWCCEAPAATIAARFIADEGELVQIETLGAPADPLLHCGQTHADDGASRNPLSPYRIRAWVKRDSVATVLRRPLRTPAAQVAAGLPVEVGDGGLVSFGLYETTREFSLPLDPSEVGMTYVPSRWAAPNPKAGPKAYRLLSGVSGSVGDGGSVALLPGERWPTSAVRRSGGDAVLPISATCARLSTSVPFSQLMEVDAAEESSYASIRLCGEVTKRRVRQGAIVYWPDGTRAGTTSGDGLWGGHATDGGRLCADLTLQGFEGSLPLCFDERDIEDRNPQRPK